MNLVRDMQCIISYVWATTSKLFTGTKIPMFMITEKYSSNILMDTKISSIRRSGVENAVQEFAEN